SRNVGNVTIRSGSTSVVLTPDSSLRYGNPGVVSGAPFGATYDVLIAGSGAVAAQTWAGAITMPAKQRLTAPALTGGTTVRVAAAAPLQLTFAPAGGDFQLLAMGRFTAPQKL